VSPDGYRIGRKIGELLQGGKDVDGKSSVGGCGLIIDYGGAKPSEDSLRVRCNSKKSYEILTIAFRLDIPGVQEP